MRECSPDLKRFLMLQHNCLSQTLKVLQCEYVELNRGCRDIPSYFLVLLHHSVLCVEMLQWLHSELG